MFRHIVRLPVGDESTPLANRRLRLLTNKPKSSKKWVLDWWIGGRKARSDNRPLSRIELSLRQALSVMLFGRQLRRCNSFSAPTPSDFQPSRLYAEGEGIA